MAVIVSVEDYQRQFNAERYLDYMYSELGKCNTFLIRELHDIFSDANMKQHRLLDIGTGPTIHTVISACGQVDEVYLSDFATQNIDILNSWLAGERDIQNNILQCICEWENLGQSVAERVSSVREKVKKVLRIDITSLDSPIGDKIPQNIDIITSSWCLESAGYTKDKYIKCVENIASLLRPGGHFVLIGDLNASTFNIGDTTFHLARFTQEELRTIYENAGFEVLRFNECSYIDDEGDVDNQGKEFTSFAMHAIKRANSG